MELLELPKVIPMTVRSLGATLTLDSLIFAEVCGNVRKKGTGIKQLEGRMGEGREEERKSKYEKYCYRQGRNQTTTVMSVVQRVGVQKFLEGGR